LRIGPRGKGCDVPPEESTREFMAMLPVREVSVQKGEMVRV
jgi:hypothetical protein